MSISNQIEIKFLVDCQECIHVLASLWYEEISRHWVKDSSVEKTKERLTSHLNKNKMPMAIVAFHNNIPVGMACLRETDGIRPGIMPWLGSLVVNPKFRELKLAKHLSKQLNHKQRPLVIACYICWHLI